MTRVFAYLFDAMVSIALTFVLAFATLTPTIREAAIEVPRATDAGSVGSSVRSMEILFRDNEFFVDDEAISLDELCKRLEVATPETITILADDSPVAELIVRADALGARTRVAYQARAHGGRKR